MAKQRPISIFTCAIFLGIFAQNSFGQTSGSTRNTAAPAASLQMPDLNNPAGIAAYNCILNPSSTDEICKGGKYLQELDRMSQFNTCKSEFDKFREASNKFAAACGDARFKSASTDLYKNLGIDAASAASRRTGFHCAQEIAVCQGCATGDTSITFAGAEVPCGTASSDQSTEGDDSSSLLNTASTSVSMLTGMGPGNSSRAIDESGRRRYEETKRDFLTCRPLALDQLRDVRKEAKEAKKSLRELQKEQTDLQNDIVNINQERSDKLNAFNDRAIEAQRRAEKGVEAIKEALEDNEKQAVNNIMRMNADIDNMEADIRRLERTKIQAEVAYKEAEANMARGCHGMALARVEKLRETLLQQAQQSQLSAGGFGKMMKSLGTNSRQRFQALAQKYYLECTKDRAYKSAMQSADRAKQFARASADDEILMIRKKQETVKTQIQAVQTSDRATAMNRAVTRINTIRTDLERTLQQLDRDQQTMSQNSMQKMFAKMGQVTQKSADVAQDQAEYSWQQRLVDLDRQYGGGSPPKEGAVDKAIAEYRSVRQAAGSAAGMCCVEGGQITNAQAIEGAGSQARTTASPSSGQSNSRESARLLGNSAVRSASNYCQQACAFPGLSAELGSCPPASGTDSGSGSGTSQ